MTRMCPLMAGPLFPPWICPLNVRGARARRPARRPPLPLSAGGGWGEGHQDYDDPHPALRATLVDPSSRLSETSSITTLLPIDSPMRSRTNDTPAFLPFSLRPVANRRTIASNIRLHWRSQLGKAA